MVMAKMKAAGAKDVQQYGESWKQADEYLRLTVIPRAQSQGQECVYVPPFDHPDIWTGHASMVQEMQQQLGVVTEDANAIPSVIACSVGGGGLLNGIMQGLENTNWTSSSTTTVLATETKGADSLAESIRQNKHITLPSITSLATTLGATKVSAKTFELATATKPQQQIKSVVLTDQEAMMGAWRFAEDERMLVELACSVTIALCYGGRLEKALQRKVSADEKVVMIVCGGSTVSIDMIAQWKRDSAHIDGEASLEEKETVPSAATVMDVLI
jgi:L-serine/L-threonine ammonia-lyase